MTMLMLMLSVIKLSVIKLNVIKLSDVMVSVFYAECHNEAYYA